MTKEICLYMLYKVKDEKKKEKGKKIFFMKNCCLSYLITTTIIIIRESDTYNKAKIEKIKERECLFVCVPAQKKVKKKHGE